MTKSKPFYVKLLGRNQHMLEFWHYDTMQEAVDKYLYVRKFLKAYDAWKLECDELTTEKIEKQEYL